MIRKDNDHALLGWENDDYSLANKRLISYGNKTYDQNNRTYSNNNNDNNRRDYKSYSKNDQRDNYSKRNNYKSDNKKGKLVK